MTRGFASGAWLALAQALHVKFVIRWIKSHFFFDQNGNKKKLWQIGQNKKYFAHKLIKNVKTGEKIACAIWWAPVSHVSYAGQLFVVKIRAKNHIMRLITNERITREDQAWEIFSPIREDGKLKQVFVMEKANWRWKVPV